MNLRLKLRKNQSTIPTEKLTKNLCTLELLGDAIETIPPLDHLVECKFLMIHCPQLNSLPPLPKGLEILKIRGGVFSLQGKEFQALESLRSLSLIHTAGIDSNIDFPQGLETLDLSGNKLAMLPEKIPHLKILKRLTLDQNDLISLPSNLYQLKTLNHLSLDNNPLSDETKNDLHKNFGLWF